jgi:phage shock protein A
MFRRLGNLIRGFFGLFISGLEKKNPEALLELEQENLRKQIAQYNQGLASHAGLCEKLIGQVKRLERESEELRAKTTANLRAGNKELAGQLAMRYQAVKRELDENRSQLTDAENTYQELLQAREASVAAARRKIEEISRGLKEVQIRQATAELNEMAAGLINQIGGSGETLNRLHEMVEDQRQSAAGRARVARDAMDLTQVKGMQAEQTALEEMALADFAAAEGLAMPAAAENAAEAPPATRAMGPQQGESA